MPIQCAAPQFIDEKQTKITGRRQSWDYTTIGITMFPHCFNRLARLGSEEN